MNAEEEMKSQLKNTFTKYLQGFQRGAKNGRLSYNHFLHSSFFCRMYLRKLNPSFLQTLTKGLA